MELIKDLGRNRVNNIVLLGIYVSLYYSTPWVLNFSHTFSVLYRWHADPCWGSYDWVYSKRNASCPRNPGNSFLLVLFHSLTNLDVHNITGYTIFQEKMASRNFFLNPKMGTDLLLAASGEKVSGNNYCFQVLNSQKHKCIYMKIAHFFATQVSFLE